MAHGNAALGQLDGGREDFAEAPRAPARKQDIPGVHHARNGAGQERIVHRNFAALVGLVPLDGGQLGGGAFGIQGEDLFGLGVVDEQGGIAAHAVHVGQHQPQDGLSGHDGIKGVAAIAQHVLGHQSGQRGHGGRGILRAAHQLSSGSGRLGDSVSWRAC